MRISERKKSPSTTGAWILLALSLFGCGGGGGDAGNVPTLTFSAFPSAARVGQQITLTWSSANVTTCLASDSWNGEVPTSGSQTGTLNEPGSYWFGLTCSGPGGDISRNVSVLATGDGLNGSAPYDLYYGDPLYLPLGVTMTPVNPSYYGEVTSFTVSPALPAGLTLDPASGQIAGTPTAATGSKLYQITAHNSYGSSSYNLSIAVITAPSSLSYPSPQHLGIGTPISPLQPTVSGTVQAFSASPSLPDGLEINTNSGEISGTPLFPTGLATYVVTATNNAGSTQFGLQIEVLEPPSALSYSNPQTLAVGKPISVLNPAVTGTVDHYSVTPSLPAGLNINSASGAISGTPTAASDKTAYFITASNSVGSTRFGLLMSTVAAPVSLAYPSPRTFPVGTAISPLNPALNGIATSYSVSPALPAGLSLNVGGGQISGTPAKPSAMGVYKVTATNVAGQVSFDLSLAITTTGDNVSPAKISRIVAEGAPASILVSINPDGFSSPGTLFAKAADPQNVIDAPVSVESIGGGRYALTLTVSSTADSSLYSGNTTITLCSDSACTNALRTIAIPYDIRILSSNDVWPGDNLSALAPWPGIADWTTFQRNAAHTGHVPVSVDANQFSTRWQAATESLSESFYENFATLSASDDRLFIAGGTKLRALKELDGSQLWQRDFGALQNPSVNPPAVANNVVYMAAGQQSSASLFALRASDGGQLFRSSMSAQWEHYLAPAIGPLGVYTNAGTYGGLFGFASSGEQLFFNNKLPQTSMWSPAVDDSHVYTYTDIGLSIIDPLTGTQESIADSTFTNYVYEIGGAPVLGAPGSVFAAQYTNSLLNGGDIGNTLLNFNVNTHSVAWKVHGAYASTPAYHDGILYAANNKPFRLEARSESNGALLWSWLPPQLNDSHFRSEVLLTNNMAFVSTDLAVYGIDLVSHQTVWSYPKKGRLALSRNGILYIESDGTLMAINLQ